MQLPGAFFMGKAKFLKINSRLQSLLVKYLKIANTHKVYVKNPQQTPKPEHSKIKKPNTSV